MTIKDISALDFADFLYKRATALETRYKQTDDTAERNALNAQHNELRAVAVWAANEVFGTDTDKRNAFMRQSGFVSVGTLRFQDKLKA